MKSQEASSVQSILHLKNVGLIPFASFLGTRSNTLLFDADSVYYLQDHNVDFYNKTHVSPNRFCLAIREDIAVCAYMTASHAFGFCRQVQHRSALVQTC